ncbi:MAG TPA: A/G-specific adenine glycosylase [Candidatus Limnocylindria bacterium]
MASPAPATIRRQVLGWFARERRDLPWRHTTEPWAVLVSEVMLQQTQAARIAERFPPFMERFPTPRSLADASDAEVLAAWSGLGYNRRALNLRRVALTVTANGWPPDVEGLRGLPGIGAYTARAVAALAFGQPVGAVDTNVRRWLTRRFDLPDAASTAQLQALADALATADGRRTTPEQAATWMHASMEFGATVCSARRPRCEVCPIARGCPSRLQQRQVPVTRQPTFSGSVRAARGAMVRALVAAPDHVLPVGTLRTVVPEAEAILDGLQRDGLAHRSGQRVRLGGAAPAGSPTTIDP